jgi:Methyltransferase domain
MSEPAGALAYLQDLPTLHHWGGREQVGGLDRRIGRRIVNELEALDRPVVLETGAGATTLLFLLLDVGRLTSIAPDEELHARVLTEARGRQIDTERLRFVVDRSEWALPPMAAAGERLDVALVDGNHGWPAVFVDFCYVNVMLRRDGILFLDDVQLHSVSQLYLLLRHQPGYERIALEGKFATFRKVSDEPFLPDWAAQPFIHTSSMR